MQGFLKSGVVPCLSLAVHIAATLARSIIGMRLVPMGYAEVDLSGIFMLHASAAAAFTVGRRRLTKG